MNTELTSLVKKMALDLGADIVGVAGVERWSKAPIEHSPQGLLPGSRSAISFGVHYLDSCIELGGNQDVTDPGPAVTNHIASEHANHIAFRLVRYLEQKGYRALAVPSTLWWSYRPRPGAPRGWIGDLSNYYAAAAAGLGEIGWNNLCLTHKFGPRQRFATVVTQADLASDPMYAGEPLCDKCLLCAKNCPMETFTRETNGMIEINYNDERKFTFPNRSMWRCAVGENFQLDVNKKWPEPITEEFIAKMSEIAVREQPELLKTWKMGMCLKYCVPPTRRYFDKGFSKSPRRRRDAQVNLNPAAIRQLFNELIAHGEKQGVDLIGVVGIEDCKKQGLDLTKYLPTAASVIVVGQSFPDNIDRLAGWYSALQTDNRDETFEAADKPDVYPNPGEKGVDVNWFTSRNAMWMGRIVQERFGFDVVMETGLDRRAAAVAAGMAVTDAKGEVVTEAFGKNQAWSTPLITSIPVKEAIRWVRKESKLAAPKGSRRKALTEKIRELALAESADLVGIAPAARLNDLASQLEKICGGKDYFIFHEVGFGKHAKEMYDLKGKPHSPKRFDIELKPKRPADYLAGAKSAIVVGIHLPDGSIDAANRPPAFKAGHYAAHVHKESVYQLSAVLLKLAKFLSANGHSVYPVLDCGGLAPSVYSNRQADLTASRFAAIAAGLGELGWNGLVLTPEFGARQRFAVLLTDAELDYNDVYAGPRLCRECGACVKQCPTCALSDKEESVTLEGRRFVWKQQDLLRCDWEKRYGLVGEGGPAAMGSTNHFKVPAVVTEDNLKAAIMESDKFQVWTYCPIVEKCFTECPAHRRD